MIPITEINDVVSKFEVPAETIEKDYIISWILHCLSKSKLREDFIFYGGTAIKRIYFDNHRFSEDIDLISSKNFSADSILKEMSVLQQALEEANLFLEIDHNSIIIQKDRMQLLVRYSGYEEITGAPKQVRIDYAMNMDLYGHVIVAKILPSYSDLKNSNRTLQVMSLNTILANKLGLLTDSTRNEPRDVFDIWFLLHRAKQFEFDFSQVCQIYKEKYGYFPSLTILMPYLQAPSLEANWALRLSAQIAKLPPIKEVTKQIKLQLEKLFN